MKFEGKLKAVYDDGQENRIYLVPRRYPGLARVVDRGVYAQLPASVGQSDLAGLRKIVAAIEAGPDAPTETKWNGTDRFEVRGKVQAGQQMLVQVTYDPQWKAISNQGTLNVRPDLLGFMLVDTPPGVEWIRFEFEKPFSKSVGEWLFFLTVGVMGWVLWKDRSKVAA